MFWCYEYVDSLSAIRISEDSRKERESELDFVNALIV
jgi:hypothetical protein